MGPSTEWREQIADDETARFDGLARVLTEIQERLAGKQPLGRALHYKAHAGLLATFEVGSGLPEWSRVGIFAEPGSYPAYVRFSNGSGSDQPDTEPDVRGLAVKLVGVPGTKIIHPDAKTQDFLAILSPAVPFATPEEFVGLVSAVSGSKLLVLPRLLGTLGLRTGTVLSALKAGLSQRVDSLTSPVYYSALPIKWGEYAVKYSFAPVAAPESGPMGTASGYREDLQQHLTTRALTFEFRVQAFVDEAKTSIEDNQKEWLPVDAPWVVLARLEIQPQASTASQRDGLAAFIESLVFDVWHAPEAFRPLGAMQRARNHAYRDSSIKRGAAPEPDGTEGWHNG
jgi:hypothetical protein